MEYLGARRDRIEDRIETVLDETEPEALREQVRHVTLAGGKRVRPTLTVLVSEALDGDEQRAIEYAVGIELVHNATLVIDDIIDDSETRRGTPAAWQAFGHGPAIVTSDGLLGEAFSLFADDGRAMESVSDALVELGQGEASELLSQPETQAEYVRLARRKTGALFRAAAELGAIAADADAETIDAIGRYAERMGVAFQMRDDVLDATADPATLGKPTGQDVAMDRPSIVEVTDLSTSEANDRATAESEAAMAALEDADLPDSETRAALADLARFVVERDR